MPSPIPFLSWSRRRFLQSIAATSTLSLLPEWLQAAPAKTPELLSGTEFTLTIAETPVNFTGATRLATTVNGSVPAPTLHWREGDTVTLTVINQLKETTSIHWHGIILPYDMDGAPGISFNGIPAGGSFTYRFKVQQHGTYWYHSHSGMQEQLGMYGAIIITPAQETIQADQDYVIQLSDWTDEDPMRVFNKLKTQSDYYNFNQPTALDFIQETQKDGLSTTVDRHKMWNEMRMSMTDLGDISAYTYTYLLNGKTSSDNWLGLFKKGERIRLRFINSAAQTFFDVRIPGLKMTIVHADGLAIEPVTVDEFRIGLAETFDVIVTPEHDAYTIFAQSMDRTGFVYGTLATRADVKADIPALDKAEPLTMMDMMGHGTAIAHHAKTEYGASVDMRVDNPRTNLDDPGIGLRNNGRRVLTYADLRSANGIITDLRAPERDIELHLTGNMERYSWSIDGVEFSESTPIHFRYGERLRVIFVNDTMMTHPMHLHGMWSDVENAEGEVQVRKHVVVVQPAQRVSFRVTADAKGYWPWHCHLFYHMHGGMFRVVVVA